MKHNEKGYVLEISLGCPFDKWPINGLFQFDQAKAISVSDYCLANDIPYIVTEHITPLNEGATIEKRKKKPWSMQGSSSASATLWQKT